MSNVLANIELGVTLSTKDMSAELVKQFKKWQTEADKNTITCKIAGDKSDMESMLKQIKGMNPELLTDVKLNFDDSYYKTEMKLLEDSSKKTAEDIGKSFKESIENSLGKFKISDVIGKTLKKGDTLKQGDVGKLKDELQALMDQTKGFDLSKATSITEIENHVVALKKIDEILKTLSTSRKDIKINGIEINIADMIESNTSNIDSIMNNVGDTIHKNASQWATTLETTFKNEFGNIVNLFNNLKDIINGTLAIGSGSGSGKGFGSGIIDGLQDIQAEIEKTDKEIQELEQKLLDLDKKKSAPIEISGKLGDVKRKVAGFAAMNITPLKNNNEKYVNQFKEIVNEYMSLGGKLEDLEGKSKQFVEQFNIEQILPQNSEVEKEIKSISAQLDILKEKREELLQQQKSFNDAKKEGQSAGTTSVGSGSKPGTPADAVISPELSENFKEELQKKVTAIGSVDATIGGELSETFKADVQTAVDKIGTVDVGVSFSDKKKDEGTSQEIPVDVVATPKLPETFKTDLQKLVDETGKYKIKIDTDSDNQEGLVPVNVKVGNAEDFKSELKKDVEGEKGLDIKVNPILDENFKLEIPNVTLKDVKVEGEITGGNLKPASVDASEVKDKNLTVEKKHQEPVKNTQNVQKNNHSEKSEQLYFLDSVTDKTDKYTESIKKETDEMSELNEETRKAIEHLDEYYKKDNSRASDAGRYGIKHDINSYMDTIRSDKSISADIISASEEKYNKIISDIEKSIQREQEIADWTFELFTNALSENDDIKVSDFNKNKNLLEKVKYKTLSDKDSSYIANDLIRNFYQDSLKIDKDSLARFIKSAAKDPSSYDKIYKLIAESMVPDKDGLYEQVRKYISSSKINVSQGVVNEFGDNWSKVQGTIGINNLSRDGGTEITILFDEMNKKLGTTFDSTQNVQDAFRELFEFLSAKPDFIENNLNRLKQDGTTKEIKAFLDDVIAEKAVPAHANGLAFSPSEIEALKEGKYVGEELVDVEEKVTENAKEISTHALKAADSIKSIGDATEKLNTETTSSSVFDQFEPEKLDESKQKYKEVGQAAEKSGEVQKRSLLDVVKELEHVQKEHKKAKLAFEKGTNSKVDISDFTKSKKSEIEKEYTAIPKLIEKIQLKMKDRPSGAKATTRNTAQYFAAMIMYVERLQELMGSSFSFDVLGDNGEKVFNSMKEGLKELTIATSYSREELDRLRVELDEKETEKSSLEKTATDAEKLEVEIYEAVKAVEKLKATKNNTVNKGATFNSFFDSFVQYKNAGGKLNISDFTDEVKVVNTVNKAYDDMIAKQMELAAARKQDAINNKLSYEMAYPNIDMDQFDHIFKQIETGALTVEQATAKIDAAMKSLREETNATGEAIENALSVPGSDPNKSRKPLGEGEILVDPVVEDPVAFANKVTEQLGSSSAEINVEPKVENITEFVEKVSDKLKGQNAVINVEPNINLTSKNNGNVTDTEIAKQEKLQSEIKETISVENEFRNLLEKDFATKNKTEATKQLKQAFENYKPYYEDRDQTENISEAGAKAGYIYYKAFEEAVSKGIARNNLEKYSIDTDYIGRSRYIGKYDNNKSEEFDDLLSMYTSRMQTMSNIVDEIKSKFGEIDYNFNVFEGMGSYETVANEIINYVRAVERLNDMKVDGIYSQEDIDKQLKWIDSLKENIMDMAAIAPKIDIQSFTEELSKQQSESKTLNPTIQVDLEADIASLNSSIQSKKDQITPVDINLSGDIASLNTDIQSKKNQILPADVSLAVNEAAVGDLKKLSEELEKIIGYISKIIEKPLSIEVDYSSIKGLYEIGEDGASPIEKLKNSIDGLQTGVLSDLKQAFKGFTVNEDLAKRLEEVAKSLKILKESLNGIDPNSTGFLNTIKELSKEAKGLKDLATVIRASQEEIKKAKDEIKSANSTGKEDEVVISRNSEQWDEVTKKASKYKDVIGDIQKITYSMRQGINGKQLKSYQVIGSKSRITLGENGKLIGERETREYQKTAEELAQIKDDFIKAANKAGVDFDLSSLSVDKNGVVTFTSTVEEAGEAAVSTRYKIKDLYEAINDGGLDKDYLNNSVVRLNSKKPKDNSVESKNSYDEEINYLERINRLEIENITASKTKQAENNEEIRQLKEKIELQKQLRKDQGLGTAEGNQRVKNKKSELSASLKNAKNVYNAGKSVASNQWKNEAIEFRNQLRDALKIYGSANEEARLEAENLLAELKKPKSGSYGDILFKDIDQSNVDSIVKKIGTDTNRIIEALKKQHEEVEQQKKQAGKTGKSSWYSDELEKIFKNIELNGAKFSKVKNVSTKDNSATIEFIEELDDKVRITTLSIKDMGKTLDDFKKTGSVDLNDGNYFDKSSGWGINQALKKEKSEAEKTINDLENNILSLQEKLKVSFKGTDVNSERFLKTLYEIAEGYEKIKGYDEKLISEEDIQKVNNYFSVFKEAVGKISFEKFDTNGKTDGFIAKLDEAKVKLESVKDILYKVESGEAFTEEDIAKIKEFIVQMRNLHDISGKKEYNLAGQDSIDKYLTKIYKNLENNTAMSKSLKQRFQDLAREMESFGGKIPKDKFDELRQVFHGLEAEMHRTGQTGLSFFDGIIRRAKSMSQSFISMYLSLWDIVRYVRTGVTYIKELDTAFTEMRKVSDESTQSLKRFQEASFDIASAVGTTAQQIQNSTADWMRLGESLNEASESASASNILLNVSEFESIDEATESLVAMSSAYDELDKMDIVDKLNQVGNNFSISTDGLATALQKSASALTTAGNDMDEAVALVTAGNAVVQDPDSVGAGLRTIALRITGTEAAKEELEELGEDTSDFMVQTSAKSQQAIKDFTKVASNNFQGFDILDDNGNFKSTYEILLGISEIYDEIVETDKQYGSNMANGLLETLAGKNRANIAASILQNPQLLKDVYGSSQDSEGSAEKELEKYLDSIEGKIAQFQNEIQEFWYNLVSSETIKTIVDFGTTVIDILGDVTGALGEIGTLAVTAGAAFGIKAISDGGGRDKKFSLVIKYATESFSREVCEFWCISE